MIFILALPIGTTTPQNATEIHIPHNDEIQDRNPFTSGDEQLKTGPLAFITNRSAHSNFGTTESATKSLTVN
jgi:hypothetical protein